MPDALHPNRHTFLRAAQTATARLKPKHCRPLFLSHVRHSRTSSFLQHRPRQPAHHPAPSLPCPKPHPSCNAQSRFLAAATCFSSAAAPSHSIFGALRRPPDALASPSRIAATPLQPRAPLLAPAVHPHPVPPPISDPQRTTARLRLLDRPPNIATSTKSARHYPSAPNVVAGQPHCDPINPVLQPTLKLISPKAKERRKKKGG